MGRDPEQNRKQREQAMEALLTAALELVAERGFSATTIAAIAKRAGVSKGLAYHYFPSKAELVRAAVKRRRDEVQAMAASIPAHATPRERMELLTRRLVEDVERDASGFLLYLRALTDPDARAATAEIIDANDRGLAGLFAAMGVENPELESSFYSVCLLGLLTHLAVSPVPGPARALADRLTQLLPEPDRAT